jgi:hypothetical protein
VPVRTDAVVLASTLILTVPLPLPLVPDVIVIQVTFSAAVHAQPDDEVTVNELLVLPDDGSDSVVGFTV